ncbi:MAG: HNH endonuclease family protein, partial [Rhodoglobus sp.]
PAGIESQVATTLEAAGLVDDVDGALHVDVTAAAQLLEQIPIDDQGATTAYDRDQFGQRWADVDRNGCDTRNDILRRDLENETFKPGTHDCLVLTGTLHDIYTGITIAFVRGQGTSEDVAIDHVFALSLAWQHGASTWSPEAREVFANDPINLQATDGPTNASKSDNGPGSWLPPNRTQQCEYVTRFAYIAASYELSLSSSDHAAIAAVLATCR